MRNLTKKEQQRMLKEVERDLKEVEKFVKESIYLSKEHRIGLIGHTALLKLQSIYESSSTEEIAYIQFNNNTIKQNNL